MYLSVALSHRVHIASARTANCCDCRFLLQKRLVVRQYKYVLYLQQMTYVLVLVLFCKSDPVAFLPEPESDSATPV